MKVLIVFSIAVCGLAMSQRQDARQDAFRTSLDRSPELRRDSLNVPQDSAADRRSDTDAQRRMPSDVTEQRRTMEFPYLPTRHDAYLSKQDQRVPTDKIKMTEEQRRRPVPTFDQQQTDEMNKTEDKSKTKIDESNLMERILLDKDLESAINDYIQLVWTGTRQYLAMEHVFNKEALRNVARFFRRRGQLVWKNVEEWIRYLEERNGTLRFTHHQVPNFEDFKTILNALDFALKLETEAYERMVQLAKLAFQKEDGHTVRYISKEFLDCQVKIIHDLMIAIKEARRAGECGFGEYLFDKITMPRMIAELEEEDSC